MVVVEWKIIKDFIWATLGYYVVMDLVMSYGFIANVSMIDATMMGLGGGVTLAFLDWTEEG